MIVVQKKIQLFTIKIKVVNGVLKKNNGVVLLETNQPVVKKLQVKDIHVVPKELKSFTLIKVVNGELKIKNGVEFQTKIYKKNQIIMKFNSIKKK